jgi:hypothetical protein
MREMWPGAKRVCSLASQFWVPCGSGPRENSRQIWVLAGSDKYKNTTSCHNFDTISLNLDYTGTASWGAVLKKNLLQIQRDFHFIMEHFWIFLLNGTISGLGVSSSRKFKNWQCDSIFETISRFQNVRAWIVLISRNLGVGLAKTAKRQICFSNFTSWWMFLAPLAEVTP